ncbi:MAG TPA: hypothetical protein VFN67_10360 [Polyangiales bacterium]|nr:hypothetical protein [Polyangiales bacterium]
MQLPPKLGERESFAEGLFDLFLERQHDQTRPAQRDRVRDGAVTVFEFLRAVYR